MPEGWNISWWIAIRQMPLTPPALPLRFIPCSRHLRQYARNEGENRGVQQVAISRKRRSCRTLAEWSALRSLRNRRTESSGGFAQSSPKRFQPADANNSGKRHQLAEPFLRNVVPKSAHPALAVSRHYIKSSCISDLIGIDLSPLFLFMSSARITASARSRIGRRKRRLSFRSRR